MNRKRVARSSLVRGASTSSRTRSRATTLASVLSISRPPFARAPRRDLRLPGRCRRYGISDRGSYGPGREGSTSRPLCVNQYPILHSRRDAANWSGAEGRFWHLRYAMAYPIRQKLEGLLERQAQWLLEEVPDPIEEARAVGAVEDPVVAGQGHRHQV